MDFRFGPGRFTGMARKPLEKLTVRRKPGTPTRGWLVAGPWTLPVALGRGSIVANKREGDGGTPRGILHPVRLWWRPDRGTRPATHLPVRRIRPDDGWCEDPSDRPRLHCVGWSRGSGRKHALLSNKPFQVTRH
jgi:L,D-peptidoglycan transpeptidase YkuD (ErfK/YbiS/YcfS/YnhG family)